MGLTLEACQQKYQFLKEQTPGSHQSTQKDDLLSHKGPNNYVLVQTAPGIHARLYHQNSDQPAKQAELYEWRKLTTKPIVPVHSVQVLPSQHSQCVQGFVYTGHLTQTLATLSELAIEDVLYLIRTSLLGFQAIFRIFGEVSIDLGNCGINEQGQCRVWINPNLCKNMPEPGSKVYRTDSEIIHETLRLFRGIALKSHQCFFIRVSTHLDLTGRVTFKEVDTFISNYSQQNNIRIPGFLNTRMRIKSIRQSTGNSLQNMRASDTIQKIKITESISMGKAATVHQRGAVYTGKQNVHSLLEFADNRTERKGKKRNSAFVTPVHLECEIPTFLTKKNIHSPKNFRFKNPDKENSFCNVSQDSGPASQITRDTVPKRLLGQRARRGSKAQQARKKSIEISQMSSLNHILAEIAQRNQENSPQKGQSLKISNKAYKAPAKRSSRLTFSHQFSINIINDCCEHKSQEGRKMKNSNLSTYHKTTIDSIKSSPRKRGSLFWDTRRRQLPFNSQLVHRNESSCLELFPERTKSGEKDYNFGGIILQIKDDRNSDYANYFDAASQGSFSFRNQNDTNRQRYQPLRNRRKVLEEEDRLRNELIKAKEEEVFNANSWKKTIENLVGGTNELLLMNKSISYGEEVPSPPIRLDRLAKIGRQITSSIIPSSQYQ